ncbi:LPS assembly lipoprotein LptE [Variovorax sp. J22G21]|uniref:LPS-assembly lipoprotein LptE n=1 Tax=Variovorax fucosicus TaxID=3053517 RepID=UPI002575E8C3|nr:MULTISPECIES: LPS assembly lipoprotein LptE [unclassified Variovorax]MDM0039607.1 LPS assembly lipoprotein LptE [Variovorax sp. J22R193]MDM0064382.1 LPS assembly lipoprotein LptE [Variovorax sp. J22G21]
MNSSSFLARRTLLVAGALTLAGCGFELRKAPVFAFKSIAVNGGTVVVNLLRRNLQAAGTVIVVPANEVQTAEVVFDMLGEDRGQRVVSTNSAGQVRELELQLTVRFRLRTQAGKELISAGEIQQRRDITYNETNALAKEGEQQLLYRDMQGDIVQQIMRQLAAVKAL